MKCERCECGEGPSYRVRSDVIDMKVCAACADKAGSLGLAVEAIDGGKKGRGEQCDVGRRDARSEVSSCCER
jgi:hypothetical protein